LECIELPFEKKNDDEICELAQKWIGENCGLEDLLKDDNENMLEVLADPAICTMRLWKDINKAKLIGNAFKAYLQKEHCKLALGAWMESQEIQKEQNAVNLAVLRYCAEGNLYAVLREWFWQEDNMDTICETLKRDSSDVRVYVQTKENYMKKEPASICCTCGFAEQLTMDHHDVGVASGESAKNTHKSIRESFNSPFWPMVLFVGRGAQEGLDFHRYCLRIMHLTLPKGAVSFDQRQGRIDRFHSLLVRRRACELLGLNVSNKQDINSAVFDTLESWKSQLDCPDIWKNDQIFPHWQIKELDEKYQSVHHFERIISVLPYTDEFDEYIQAMKQLNSYRSTIGSADINLPEEYLDLMIDLSAG